MIIPLSFPSHLAAACLAAALLSGAGAAPASPAQETPAPEDLPVAEPWPEEVELSPQETARRVKAARRAFEIFHEAMLGGDVDTAWRYLSESERKDLYQDDLEVFRKEVAALREDEEEWVVFRTMALVEVELDEDDPDWAWATVRFRDADGYEDEDDVDLVLQGGRWRVEGYF